MSIQFSETVRNAKLDAVETAIGASAKLYIRSGAAPANCAAADSGDLLATFDLPSDWMAPASGGQVAKAGTWQETSADGTGTAAHFRIKDSGGTTCHIQGTVTATGGGGDVTLDNVSIAATQQVTISGFTLTEGNA